MPDNAPTKLAQLQAIFREMDRALIAYSGGIDSTLVAKVAMDVLGRSRPSRHRKLTVTHARRL